MWVLEQSWLSEEKIGLCEIMKKGFVCYITISSLLRKCWIFTISAFIFRMLPLDKSNSKDKEEIENVLVCSIRYIIAYAIMQYLFIWWLSLKCQYDSSWITSINILRYHNYAKCAYYKGNTMQVSATCYQCSELYASRVIIYTVNIWPPLTQCK